MESDQALRFVLLSLGFALLYPTTSFITSVHAARQ
jgi:hypothetical protein